MNSAAGIGRPTWKQCNKRVVAVMLVGMGLMALWPVWLAPPLLAYTPVIYLALALAWLPTLIICALLRPTGERHGVVLLIVIGIFGLFVVLALVGPNGGVLGIMPSDCQREVIQQGTIRYTCKQPILRAYVQYVFEGSQGSPFARLVETRLVSTD